MSSSSTPTNNDSTPAESEPRTEESQPQSKQPLPLPEPPAHGDGNTTTLDVSGGGSTVKLDHLGPLVVNQDGTMSRISNWAEMSEIERQNTLRVLGKRNQIRLEGLKRKAEQESGGSSQ